MEIEGKTQRIHWRSWNDEVIKKNRPKKMEEKARSKISVGKFGQESVVWLPESSTKGDMYETLDMILQSSKRREN